MIVNPNIIEVTVPTFQTEVLEASQQKPVLLEFYAEGAEQSAALAVTLRKLADEYQGKFLLARVDVQQNSQIVQQLGDFPGTNRSRNGRTTGRSSAA